MCRPRLARLLLLALLAASAACGEKLDPVRDELLRERVAAHFAEESWGAARAALAPLLERKQPAFEDLVRGAALELADGRGEACAGLLARAEKLRPTAVELRWLRGQLARAEGGPEGFARALEHFRAVHAARPDDLPARLALAEAELEAGASERALELYRSVVEVGLANGGAWYATAVFRLYTLLLSEGGEQEAEPYRLAWEELEAAGVGAPAPLTLALGELARVAPPRPSGTHVAKPAPLAPYARRGEPLAALAGARELALHDLEGDHDSDLLATTPTSVLWAVNEPSGLRPWIAHAGPVRFARAFDLDNDADLDLVLVGAEGEVFLLRCEQGPEGPSYSPLALSLPALPTPPADVVPVDFDHEGDVDLLLVGSFGARLWRNDGLDEPEAGGTFRDASEGSGLPADRSFAWALCEDFDGDNDVDLLLGGPEGLVLASSLRGGRFELLTPFPAGTGLAERPIVQDFDGDGRPDLWPVGGSAPWLQGADGRFRPGASERAARAPRFLAADLDLDGALDVLGVGEGEEPSVLLAAGLATRREAPILGLEGLPREAPLVALDLDGDRVPELAAATGQGLLVWKCGAAAGRARRLVLRGVRDNRRALGATVEYRVGAFYRRLFWRGEPELLGAGRAEKLDVLRVTWPNGVISTLLDVRLEGPLGAGASTADGELDVWGQSSGQAGSCPFLYTWNGAGFEFISDVLGITPLGLPMAPGMLVPPDHDEYVLVRGEQLVPRDGRLVVQLTEELREVTYLDQARLVALDHPEGTRVLPDERFTFPPFPEPRVHTVSAAHPPLCAKDAQGRDWTEALARVDGVHAEPFELEGSQYGGLAKPWLLELEFDPEIVREARGLRLLLTGWFFWSDASSNMAGARHPRVAFVPPTLQVPDADGGWRDTGPPIGFPAGKTKTMVVEVDEFLSREDPRLRLASTLRLYWDAIELATCGDDAELVETALEPVSARAWRRGFSAPLEPETPYGEAPRSPSTPERFAWDQLADPPRWNPHPGRYTRYGECLELVREIDDRFVILGAGDALEIAFPAERLPPLRSGWRRDWLVFLDGWAKDRDPNTLEALEVEPLPFHGMSGYPYGPEERFPDGELHRRWRAEWLTREPEPWIRPLSLARQHEALGAGAR